MLLPEMVEAQLAEVLSLDNVAFARWAMRMRGTADVELAENILAWRYGRRIYVLDAPTQWALSRTQPPEWARDEANGWVGAACGSVDGNGATIWIQFAQPISDDVNTAVGCFVGDAQTMDPDHYERMARGESSRASRGAELDVVSVTARNRVHITRLREAQFNTAMRGLDAAASRIAAIALNFLAAMRYTKRLEATERKLPKASPKEERHERRTGRTRAPWTTIRLAVGGSEPAIQREIQARAPAASTGATHASPVGHWVTGHWHRYWVLQPDANDKPDATKDEDGRVLHRVARWLQPYFVDGPAADPVAPRVAKVVLA